MAPLIFFILSVFCRTVSERFAEAFSKKFEPEQKDRDHEYDERGLPELDMRKFKHGWLRDANERQNRKPKDVIKRWHFKDNTLTLFFNVVDMPRQRNDTQ